MATLFYAVYESAGEVALGDPIQEGTVTIGVASAQSATISGSGRKRKRVRLYADVNAFVTWGSNPTALNDGTDGRPMGADNPEYFDIEAGHKIATILR